MGKGGTIALTLCFLALRLSAQSDTLHSNFASKAGRKAFFQNFLVNYIQRDLPLPLADSTEDDWSDPFYGLELMRYKTPYVLQRITQAWDHMDQRTVGFQRDYLELIYTNYPHIFRSQVSALLRSTPNERIFALCAEYLLADPGDNADRQLIHRELEARLDTSRDVTLELLRKQLNHIGVPTLTPPLEDLLSPDFLAGEVVVFSFQRSNRDYPGLVIVRRGDGTFLRNPDSSYVAIPQLARSITNLPYFLHNGNTPEGIYRMEGIGYSSSMFLGPTGNLQLRMPYEVTPAAFFHNRSISDTAWRLEAYAHLLPHAWNQDFSMYGAFFAGLAGRREIIAHGTAIDPTYYKDCVWYPETPSLGCLCAGESWGEGGKRLSSDQQKIVDALDTAGGSQGYLVVVDLDDWPGPVTIANLEEQLNHVTLHPHAPVSLSRKNAAHQAR